MADERLRAREREYFAAPTQESLLRFLEERIRAGLELEPDRVRALVAKPAMRCFVHTVEATAKQNGGCFILEMPATGFTPRPFPELGGQYEYFLPLASDHAHPFRGYTIDLVTFEEATTGARLSTKPIGGPLFLHAGFDLRFTFNFGEAPPPLDSIPPPTLTEIPR